MPRTHRANWFAMLWSGGVALCLVYLPAIVLPVLGTTHTTYERTASGGVARYTERTVGPLAGSSSAEYASVLLPLLIAIVPLLVSRSERWRRVTSAVAAALVGLYVVLGFMTLGLLYAPAAVALAIAASPGPERPGSPVTA